MEKIKKKGKWILHELFEMAIQNRLITLASSQKKQFLYQINDKKWTYYPGKIFLYKNIYIYIYVYKGESVKV